MSSKPGELKKAIADAIGGGWDDPNLLSDLIFFGVVHLSMDTYNFCENVTMTVTLYPMEPLMRIPTLSDIRNIAARKGGEILKTLRPSASLEKAYTNVRDGQTVAVNSVKTAHQKIEAAMAAGTLSADISDILTELEASVSDSFEPAAGGLQRDIEGW